MTPCTSQQKSAMQDQTATASDQLQRAAVQLTEEQRHFLHARLTDMQNECNRLLKAKRAADERCRHAYRILAAVEARIDAVENQAEELLTALEGLVSAVDGYVISGAIHNALCGAQALIQRYGPSEPVEAEG